MTETEAKFRAEVLEVTQRQKEEAKEKEKEAEAKREQRIAADGMVERARMLAESLKLDAAKNLLAKAADAYLLAGLERPAPIWSQVEAFVMAAEEEGRSNAEAEAERAAAEQRGHAYLAKVREMLHGQSKDFDALRGYCEEAGTAFRQAALPAMEDEVLEILGLVSEREDEAVKGLLHVDRLRRYLSTLCSFF